MGSKRTKSVQKKDTQLAGDLDLICIDCHKKRHSECSIFCKCSCKKRNPEGGFNKTMPNRGRK